MADVSKVEYGGRTLVDLTNDTVTPETLAKGATAHDKSGKLIVGTMSPIEAVNSINECTDINKLYVLPDGFIYAWMLTKTEVEGGSTYKNILETYKPQVNKRWSYSGKSFSTANGYMAVGPLPVKPEDIVRINHVYKAGASDPLFTKNYCRVHYLDASNNYVSGNNDKATYRDKKLFVEDNATYWVVGYANATDTDPSTNTKMAGYDNITQMVAVFAINEGTVITEADVAGYIMTINQEIKEGGGTTVPEFAWVNTGRTL